MIITIVNHKGGVGKTSISVNLAAALGNQKKRVLVIDNDPQSNASRILLKDTYQQKTMYEILDPGNANGFDIAEFIHATKTRNVWAIPNIEATSGLEIAMANDFPRSQFNIRDKIRDYALANFDVTLIDCQPTLGLMVANAMIAADAVIVPIDAGSAYSIDNLRLVLNMIEKIRDSVNARLKFMKIVINRTDRRTLMSRVLIDEVNEKFGKDMVFKTKLPASTIIQQAEYAKETILKWRGGSIQATAYRNLARELVSLID